MLFITKETISTIETNKDGTATLTLYDNKKIIFQKTYKNFSIAKMIETKKLQKM